MIVLSISILHGALLCFHSLLLLFDRPYFRVNFLERLDIILRSNVTQTRRAYTQTTHIQAQNFKKECVHCVSQKNHESHNAHYEPYNVYTMGDKDLKKQLAVYDSDTRVTLNQGQGHQTWYELVDPQTRL